MRDYGGIARDPASIPHRPAADPAALLHPIPPRSRLTFSAMTKWTDQREAAELLPGSSSSAFLRPSKTRTGLWTPIWTALAACLDRHWTACSPHASRFRGTPHASRILRRSRTHPARNARRCAVMRSGFSPRHTASVPKPTHPHFAISCGFMRAGAISCEAMRN